MALHHIAQKVTENYRRLVVMWECGWSVGYFTGALLHRRDTTQARYYTGAILHRRVATQALWPSLQPVLLPRPQP
jgi:hypothetical protein